MRSDLLFVIALIISTAVVGCGGPPRLALTSSEGMIDSTARPSTLPPSDSLFQKCSAVKFEGGQWQMSCTDLITYFGIRYDATFSKETCRDVLRQYDQVSEADQEWFPLLDQAYTFRITGMSPRIKTGTSGVDGLAACIPHREGGVALLVAQRGLTFDRSAATKAITVLAFDGVPDTRTVPRRPSKTPLLGRTLKVAPSCKFMGAQNLSCFPYGQMDWGRFSSLKKARHAQDLKISEARKKASTVLRDTTVQCTFEEVETQCRWMMYEATATKIPTLGASNKLIALYAAADVRGIPAQATCSFFLDQAEPNGLALLCSESFKVPSAADLLDRHEKD